MSNMCARNAYATRPDSLTPALEIPHFEKPFACILNFHSNPLEALSISGGII